ncbi:MAG: AAA domain-containing protein [Roseiflexaceae bacterium]|jgi:hypothetical protein
MIIHERFDIALHHDGTRRVSPTDIALHHHLDSCQRFLRLRLYEHNTGAHVLGVIMRRNGIAVQPPSPLPAIVGQAFEYTITDAIKRTGMTVVALGEIDTLHNEELCQLITTLPVGHVMCVLQPNLEAVLGQWTVTGRPDMLRIMRQPDGQVHVLVTDIKSAFRVKPEHRTQVAIYHIMLDVILRQLPACTIATSVLFQPPHHSALTTHDHQALVQAQQAAATWFGVTDACLELIAQPLQLRNDVARMFAFDPRSSLLQSIETRFSELPYAICRTCEGCRYMELCLTDSDQRQDVALIPLLDRESRRAFVAQGIKTVTQVAELKLTNAQRTLEANPNYARELHTLGNDTQLGPLLDYWIVRAQQLRNSSDRQTAVAAYPEQSFISLPRINTEKNPTAVVLYVDMHVNHLTGFVWQCGALLDYYLNGVSYTQYHVVEIAEQPPTTLADERSLLQRWLIQIIRLWDTHIRNSDTTHTVPFHVVVYDATVWHAFNDALNRHYDDTLCQMWHDFVTTPRPHDAPLTTMLIDEIRNANRITTTVPSLMALASLHGFRWQDEHYNYRAQFQYMHFDASGRMADGDGYYIQRARFSSAIPLEYAYAAWQALPNVDNSTIPDSMARFRHVTRDMLVAYCRQRLLGLAHLAKRAGRWWNSRCDAVDIRTIAHTHAAPTQLSGVVREYMDCERHAELRQWRTAHEPFPLARVRAGTSLIVEFRMVSQSQQTVLQLTQLAKTYTDGTPIPMNRVRLVVQICANGELPPLAQQLELSELAGESSSAILNPLHNATGKPIWADQLMQQGMRVKVVQRNSETGMLALDVESMQHDAPYSYGGRSFMPVDGARYVLDTAPDNVPARVANRALQRVLAGADYNTLYRHLAELAVTTDALDADAMHEYIAACDQTGPFFAGDARHYVAGYAAAPMLLVQGPPGTGKTFTTAHAVMARMYAAMRHNRPLRVVISCQTHAAINELLNKLADVKTHQTTQSSDMAKQLQRIALFRYRRPDTDAAHTGIQHIQDKAQMLQLVQAQQWCVVGATPTSIESLAADDLTWCDVLILDEASQMSIPHALIAARVLHATGMLIVVGDPRQMPVIVAHDWDSMQRRSFVRYPVYRALFDYLRDGNELFGQTPAMVRLATSYRVPPQLADFLRHEIYQHDGIAYHSVQQEQMRLVACRDAFVAAVLHPDYPIIVIEHDESGSRTRNLFEANLVTTMLVPLIQAHYDAQRGFGVVVPHRLQRSTIKSLLRPHMPARADILFDEVDVAGVDTVERYQGSERDVMIVSATESDSAYIRRNESFLFDMRRLNVALSRARHKVIVVASEQVLDYIAQDPTVAAQSQLWKNLRQYWCTHILYDVEIAGQRVRVRGFQKDPATTSG